MLCERLRLRVAGLEAARVDRRFGLVELEPEPRAQRVGERSGDSDGAGGGDVGFERGDRRLELFEGSQEDLVRRTRHRCPPTPGEGRMYASATVPEP